MAKKKEEPNLNEKKLTFFDYVCYYQKENKELLMLSKLENCDLKLEKEKWDKVIKNLKNKPTTISFLTFIKRVGV